MPPFFQRLRIGQRLGLAFSAIVVLMLAIAVVGQVGFGRVERVIHAINEDHSVKVFRAATLLEVANQQARSTRNLLLIDDAATRAEERRRVGDTRAEATRLYEELTAMADTAAEREALAAVTAKRTDYARALDAYLALFDAGRTDDARRLLITEVRDRQLDYMRMLKAYSQAQQTEMAEAGRAADAVIDTATGVMFGAAGVGALMAAVAGWLVARSITRPIGEAVAVARRVAAGDLSSRIVVERHDETGALLHALRTMNDNLVALVADVRASSDSIAIGSGQIATGSGDLSQRTEEQASNLQQTAASMEQLNATVRTSAETAAEATRLAGVASDAAARGGEVVGEVVGTMRQISEASRRIADIIGVIDGIAFQTNILALNAAVEAARAGEQGRGFAVVAGEVRSLAQRSAQAAREIKSLISASGEKVETGARLADAAGQSMTDLVSQVRRVSELIGDIGHAAREQAQGIGQVNDAVSQLDQVTQQNAALVEESTAAAESLKEQAQRLVGAVARFRVEAGVVPAG